MPTKEKIFYVSICNQTIPNICQARKLIVGNNGLMFLPPLERAFDFFKIT
jgi:hypothetical protein